MKQKMNQICNVIIKGHIHRMNELCIENKVKDARSLYDEIKEWIRVKDIVDIIHLEELKKHFD